MKPVRRDGDFERWLDGELKRTVPVRGPSPRAAQAAYRRLPSGAVPGLLRSITARGLAVLAAAALTIGGGAVVATAATGTANPASWGQMVVEVVRGCGEAGGDPRCAVPGGGQRPATRATIPAGGRGHERPTPTMATTGTPAPGAAHPSPGATHPTPAHPTPGDGDGQGGGSGQGDDRHATPSPRG